MNKSNVRYEQAKVMISQPMQGISNDEIQDTKQRAVNYLEKKGYSVVNTLFTDELYDLEQMQMRGVRQIPLWFLSKSLDSMAFCDSVYFCKGWENARGCRIEHEAAKAYGLQIIYEEN